MALRYKSVNSMRRQRKSLSSLFKRSHPLSCLHVKWQRRHSTIATHWYDLRRTGQNDSAPVSLHVSLFLFLSLCPSFFTLWSDVVCKSHTVMDGKQKSLRLTKCMLKSQLTWPTTMLTLLTMYLFSNFVAAHASSRSFSQTQTFFFTTHINNRWSIFGLHHF